MKTDNGLSSIDKISDADMVERTTPLSIRFRLGSDDLVFADTDRLISTIDSPVTPTQDCDRLGPKLLQPPSHQPPENPRQQDGEQRERTQMDINMNHNIMSADDKHCNQTPVASKSAHVRFSAHNAAGVADGHSGSMSDPIHRRNGCVRAQPAEACGRQVTRDEQGELTGEWTDSHSSLQDNISYEETTFEFSDPELKRRHSLFGDMNAEPCATPWSNKRASVELGLRNQLFSFLQASDNKLAMKLFGSKSALLKEKQRQFVAHTWIIHPCSNFRLYWDLLMLIFLVTNLVVLPVAIAFFFNDMGSHWMIFNISCDTLFILDIIINFRTGLIDQESHGDVILDAKVIATRYLKGWFVVDFFSSLPIDYIFLSLEGHSAGRAIRILRLAKLLQLLRLLRISRLVRYVRIWQEYFSLASIVVRIINLICVMVLLSHWSGCIQFFVPVIQGWPKDSWISIEKLQNVHWWDQYTKSLFKALSHMLCIGYGQFPPSNNTDMWLTIASMLAGATCYALFVGHATTLIQSFDTSSRQFRDHLQQVNEYMSFRKLPPDLRQRITTYYDHKYGGKMFDEQVILSELSDSLRSDIVYHNCKELICTVPFFEKADPNFVNDVISKLKFELCMPGDTIITVDTKGDRMFFIQEGLVEIINDADEVVTRLADGSYFGEVSLLCNQKRVATVRASTYCNLFALWKEDFDHILACYPLMRRTLETIAAKRLHHLGKDPSLVTSRESLLDDINGIQSVMQVNHESPSDEDESPVCDEVTSEDNQFLTVFKSFFTTDSDNFTRNRLQLSRNSSPKRVKGSCQSSKSNLQYLLAPVIVPTLPRRVQSSIELSGTRNESESCSYTEKSESPSPTLKTTSTQATLRNGRTLRQNSLPQGTPRDRPDDITLKVEQRQQATNRVVFDDSSH